MINQASKLTDEQLFNKLDLTKKSINEIYFYLIFDSHPIHRLF